MSGTVCTYPPGIINGNCYKSKDGGCFLTNFKRTSSRPRHRLPLTVALSATLAFASVPVAGLSQQTAWAEDIDTNVQADAAQQEVERTAAEYDQAISRIDDLNQQIADNEARIAEIEETLPAQQERSSAAAVKL